MKKYLLILCVLPLVACSGAREQLGIDRKAPDEFAVIKRAPLALPPDYRLRPPEPGAPRPQEQATSQQARQAVFGSTGSPQKQVTDAEGALLQQAGANYADPDIRRKVNAESKDLRDDNKPVVDKLLDVTGLGDDEVPASVVDPAKELERIQKNTTEGKPINEGETPTIED